MKEVRGSMQEPDAGRLRTRVGPRMSQAFTTRKEPSARPFVDVQMPRTEVASLVRQGFADLDVRVRVGPHHVDTLLAVASFDGLPCDVNALYRRLLDRQCAYGMTQIYRALKVLERAGLVARRLQDRDGRPRNVYFVPRADSSAAGGHPHVCERCGASLPPPAQIDPVPRRP